MMRYINLGIRAVLTLAFVLAGAAKLLGADMMVGTFEAVGIGQWFRYVTGIIEVASGALLWVSGLQLIGAGLMTITMIGAVLAQALVLGSSAMPAMILGLMSGYIAFLYRGQFTERAAAT